MTPFSRRLIGEPVTQSVVNSASCSLSLLVAKRSLSAVSVRMKPGDDSSVRHVAHVFLMGATTQDKIGAFIADLYAFDSADAHTGLFRAAAAVADAPFADRGFA
ncbi:hypothetical protein [Actinokineospora inagensis]|uniref:hypothetical protein n=1 Tax=Actinokineospora inagensis TaxID=103730 RepID=UPI000410E539|nr:hypothetical protein [Actinokineospora inagensis]